jgi:hypothetical protein
MERSDIDVGEFIAGLPNEVRNDIATLDAVIAGVFDGLDRSLYTGKMWGGTDQEIIGYGTYLYGKNQDEWFIVGLAVQKRHLSLYINAVEDRQYLSEKYGHELGKVKVGKAALTFGSAADLDLERLEWVMRKSREIFESDA